MKESDLLHSAEGIGGNEKITLGDILYSIEADKMQTAEAPSAAVKDGKTAAG